jgi:hypothetical protein
MERGGLTITEDPGGSFALEPAPSRCYDDSNSYTVGGARNWRYAKSKLSCNPLTTKEVYGRWKLQNLFCGVSGSWCVRVVRGSLFLRVPKATLRFCGPLQRASIRQLLVPCH